MEIPPEPPPGGAAQDENMSADGRGREEVVDRRGLEREMESREMRERVGSAQGKRRCREERREAADPAGQVEAVRMQALSVAGHQDDATQRWLRELKMKAPATEEWPAPKGSVADV